MEFHTRSAFSFLRGASQPEALARRAAALEIPVIAVTDRDGVYGSARTHAAAKEAGIRAVVGAELTTEDGTAIPVLAATAEGYGNLCRLITKAKLRGTKQNAPVHWSDLPEFAAGLIALTGDEDGPIVSALQRDDLPAAEKVTRRLMQIFGPDHVYVEIQRHLRRGEAFQINALRDLAASLRLPLLATNGVLHATREERTVMDVFSCTRHHTHLDAAGRLLTANDERHLKPASMMRKLFANLPEAVTNATRLADRITFTLDNLGYEFPVYPVPPGDNIDTFLRKITLSGARARYSHLSGKVLRQLNHELDLIAKLGFSGYFLIVWDLVNFCSSQGLLVQGRGSAENSVVCYALGITACDPIACQLLFERFLSEGRTTWPDIDLDLPSGARREQVIQEVYRRYGPAGAAMTANVITYRGRSAMREIGKALHFPPDVLSRFSHLFAGGDFPHTMEIDAQLRQAGIPSDHPRMVAAMALYQQIYGLPRHLGQHSGGMIICQGKLSSIVPLEHASMEGRIVAQWDKDDCADLGIIKVDLLGLGMMAVMQDTLELCAERGRPVDLATIAKDDTATYDLMCAADTVGVFQIESRAQMATLPRMQPRVFYDVVVEVAIIRPGPISGGLLHPYLQRRQGREAIDYIDDRLKPVLERTLGVPLFQEQLLQISMTMAGFSGSEAEELRRALSFGRSKERMEKVCIKLRAGMERQGVSQENADNIVNAVQCFAVYGFPESHAISFALIAYASCWMKVHRAAEFYCGLFNNQPMGFYSPATLEKDARRRGLKMRPVSVLESDWFCRVDDDHTIRLGLCYLRGLRRIDGERIVAQRGRIAFKTLADFQVRTALPQNALRALAQAGALNGLATDRRDAQWQVEVHRDADDLFSWAESQNASKKTTTRPLTAMTLAERTQADYVVTGLTTGPHPMAHLRAHAPHLTRASDLKHMRTGTWVRVGGMVICRQRPGTAKGIVFVSLEDETGMANAIISAPMFEKHRLTISEEAFLEIGGILQNVDNVINIKARQVLRLGTTEMCVPASHDFR